MFISLVSATLATLVGGWLRVEHRCQYVGKKILIVLSLLLLATPSYILAATLSSRINAISGSYFRFEGLSASIVCLTLVCIPYGQLTISSALARVSGSEEQAARVLGASPFQAFRVAVWPQIKDGVVLSFFIAFLYALSDFGAVATLDAPVLTWRLYEAIRTQDLARAAVLGLGSLVATVPIFILSNLLRGSPSRKANPSKPSIIPLPRLAKIGTYGLHFLLIFFGLLLPIFELISWILDGWSRELIFVSQWDSTFATILLSAVGAFFTLLFVLAPTWLYVQRSSLYKNIIYLSSALPGVLLAFGLMIVCLNITKYTGGYALVLSSGLLLFLGYAMRFLSEAFGPIASSMMQLNPRLMETAQSLDRFPLPWFKVFSTTYSSESITSIFTCIFRVYEGASKYSSLGWLNWLKRHLRFVPGIDIMRLYGMMPDFQD